MNVEELSPQSNAYEFEHLGDKTSVSFDEKNLYILHECKCCKRNEVVPLNYLVPKIFEEESQDPEAAKSLRYSFFSLAGAVIVFFSEINGSVPLLAPAMLIFGAFIFITRIRRAWVYSWLSVKTDLGKSVLNIRTVDAPEEVMVKARLKAFTNGLTKAIEEAKRQ